MTFPQLRCFTTVARLENVSQAAELLHMIQSYVSKSIAKLEEELGTPLFARRGRKLTLNAARLRLLEYSDRTLQELERTRDDLRFLSTGTETRLRIGSAWTGHSLLECIAGFRGAHPEAALDLGSGIERYDSADINDYDMLIYRGIRNTRGSSCATRAIPSPSEGRIPCPPPRACARRS